MKKYEGVENLKTITIHPKDDKTLRNRDFIDRVGTFASEHGITIFLEGTILAHPVYALASKGVRIILAKKNKEIIEKNNFNKLVRDKIPDKIVGNMEQIKCYIATGNVLIRYLKEKLVEEIFEACDSKEEIELVGELADAYEVLETLKEELCINSAYKDIRRERIVRKLLDGDTLIRIAEKRLLGGRLEEHYYCKYDGINILVEREHQCIEIEITITNRDSSYSSNYENENTWKDEIVRLAYQILDEKRREFLLLKCEELLKLLDVKRKELKISREVFSRVRKEKNDRNGELKCGFVLQETQMRTETQKMDSEIELPICFNSTQEEYPELSELLFEPITYVDYRENQGNELIIRIKSPLCLNIWQNEIAGKHVEAVFGKNSRLLIEVERREEYYTFTICLLQENYEQLTFDGCDIN